MIKTFENFIGDFFTSNMYYIDLLKENYKNYKDHNNNIIMNDAKSVINKLNRSGVYYKIYIFILDNDDIDISTGFFLFGLLSLPIIGSFGGAALVGILWSNLVKEVYDEKMIIF